MSHALSSRIFGKVPTPNPNPNQRVALPVSSFAATPELDQLFHKIIVAEANTNRERKILGNHLVGFGNSINS